MKHRPAFVLREYTLLGYVRVYAVFLHRHATLALVWNSPTGKFTKYNMLKQVDNNRLSTGARGAHSDDLNNIIIITDSRN